MSIDSDSRKGRLQVTAFLLAIVTFGMALRLCGLDADSLWLDEITTHFRSQFDIPSLMAHMTSAPAALDQGPLVYLVTHISVFCLGDSDFVLRLQAMLFGSFSILLAYKVGEILWTRQEGLVGALLMAVNPYHIQYSQVARHYGLMVFLALLSLIFLLKALQKNQMRIWLAFVLCTSLSLYNHYFAFLFLPAEIIFATWVIAQSWLSNWKKHGLTSHHHSSSMLSSAPKRGAMFIASLCLVVMSYLPWLTMLQALISREMGSQGIGLSMDSLQSSLGFLRTVLSDFSGAQGVSPFLWAALFVLGLASRDWKQTTLIALWIGVPFAFLAVAGAEHGVASRYVLFILPLYLLTIAQGVTSVGQFLMRPLHSAVRTRKWLLPAICAVTVTALVTVNLARLAHYYARPKRDWRGAAEYLTAESSPGDVVLYPGEGSYNIVGDTLLIYLRRRGVETLPVLQIRRGLGQAIAQNFGDANGQVAAAVYPEDALVSNQVANEVSIADFEGVSIVRLRELSGDLLQDTISMLQVLLNLLPAPEAHFDVHLALADIYLRTGGFEQAQSHLDMAGQLRPDTPRASRHLDRTLAEFEQLSWATDEDIQFHLWRSLGLQIAFLGYDLDTPSVPVGGTVEVSLWWEALDRMEKHYTAFIHVVGPDERIWAQQDTLLQEGNDPTSTWELGKTVREEYELPLPPDTPPGEYAIQAGVYYWETGERLPVWDEDRQRVAQDAVKLGSITVTR